MTHAGHFVENRASHQGGFFCSDTCIDNERSTVRMIMVIAVDRVGQTKLFANFLEQAGAHIASQDGIQQVCCITVRMVLRQALDPEADLSLFQFTTGDFYFSGDNRGNIVLLHARYGPVTKGRLDQSDQLFVVDATGGNNAQVLTNITGLHKLQQLLPVYVTDSMPGADDRHAERVPGPEGMGKLVVDQIFGAILDHGDLLQDNPSLFLYVIRTESGVTDHIAEQVDRHRQFFSEDLDEITAEFTAGKAIEKTTYRINLAGNRLRGAPIRAFEKHVFDKVGDTVQSNGFMTRAIVYPYSKGNRMASGHIFGKHPDAIIEHRTLSH